jgi:hypothetical protein
MHQFDIQALSDALDAERHTRGLTWAELVAEINEPFKGTTSIPITLQTIRRMTRKSSVTSAVVLQILRWLDRSPESFLKGRNEARAEERLPDAGPHQILRFDTSAIYKALQEERERRGKTWAQVASEMPGFTPSMLSNLANGPLIGFPRVMVLTQWLGHPAAAYIKPRNR